MKPDQNKILLSIAYLPTAEYFYYLMKADTIYIEQFETYPKQTYRNRCIIYSEKGEMPLIIPVTKPDGNHTKIKDVLILNREKWYLNHWRAIEAAYLASPYFLYYRDELELFYTGQHENLFRFNLKLLNTLFKLTGINPNIKLTRNFVKKPRELYDLRYAITPKKTATLNHFPEYIQVFSDRHGFIPNLSIIDALFNLGPDTMDYLERVAT
ncbi:MAG TPA: hypothetical protein ENH02_07335 [Bacteroidetes bacterium]|nr:hypothetical protein [Bacteroidota bacterium]